MDNRHSTTRAPLHPLSEPLIYTNDKDFPGSRRKAKQHSMTPDTSLRFDVSMVTVTCQREAVSGQQHPDVSEGKSQMVKGLPRPKVIKSEAKNDVSEIKDERQL